MKLPKKVKVGWRTYKVESWPIKDAYGEDKLGTCDKNNGIIRITEGHGDEDTLEVFLHEILHACYHEWRIEPEDDEERTVSSLSTALMSVFKENPEVVKLLK